MARKASSPISTSPLVIDPQREHRVRERAYLLWESEGKPHGRDVEYWERARHLLASEETAGAAPTQGARTPEAKPGKTPAKAQRASEETKSEPAAGRGKAAAQPDEAARRKSRPKSKKG